VREPAGGREVTVPPGGAAAPESVPVLSKAFRVDLGVHRFGRVRKAGAVVARPRPGQVGFFTPQQGAPFGPHSFLVGPDRSVWLIDELKRRLLVWRPGRPSTFARTVPLPFFAIDFALGPAGSILGRAFKWEYVMLRLGRTCGVRARFSLSHVAPRAAFGDVITDLRIGPDGRLYQLGSSPRTGVTITRYPLG
jgi:hypothetical protein